MKNSVWGGLSLNGRFRLSAERFRISYLREDSTYDKLRTFLPVPLLAGVWLLVIPASAAHQHFFEQSITVRHLLLALAIFCAWHLWLSLTPYSRRSTKEDIVAEIKRLVTASFVCGALPYLANLARGIGGIAMMLAALTMLLFLLGSGIFFLGFFSTALLSHRLMKPRLALLVGTGRRALALSHHLEHHHDRFEVLGCVDDEYHGLDPESERYLGTLEKLPALLKAQPIEVVLIALPLKSKYDMIQHVIDICETIGVESHYMQDIFESSRIQTQLHARGAGHLNVFASLKRAPQQYLKRALDIVIACAVLLLLSPLMLAAAIAVRLSSPGPILFVQQRYGQNRKLFPMFKFRSMVADAEQRQASLESNNEAQGPVFKLKSDPRVTRVGNFLRRSSIDELPQLFNVLRGEMSLVGPRPLPLRDVSRFEEAWLLRRFSVKPGLTCLWQVTGRSNTSFDSWIRQDLTYIDEWSLSLDLKILFMTIPAVLKGAGAV